MVLTLPMAGLIKAQYPQSTVFFLGRTYTKEIVALSEFVDGFINYDDIEKLAPKEQIKFIQKYQADIFLHVFPKKKIAELAKAARIPLRVGTTNRIYHWLTCNKLVKLSRRKSDLHEAQLNLKLLSFLNINSDVLLEGVQKYYGFTKIPKLEEKYDLLIDKTKFNLILHPKSKGSAKEWGLDNFKKLIELLPPEKFKVFISGTKQDGELMKEFLEGNHKATDITGQLALQQFIAFINKADGLVAASTGPLHIAAALNKNAVGLFSPKRPIHPGRWMPLGKKANVLVADENCPDCQQKKDCDCITKIKPEEIIKLLTIPDGVKQ
ncbi:glycosyl transferase family 9 [Sphingobacteriaceae bacterium]|nr:glycosyl transferase family 9 [Sphingobacteriaceae bacterium]